MTELTIGSLFSGIGGLELGLERAGVGRTVWQVEQSEYCRAVLAKHWPDATRYEDVRNVGRANLVPVDVICGGFPCQDISAAGKKVGIDGERSGLWSEYARIVRELRPRYVVVENVARLLADGMGRVLGELASIGYDAEWDCLPASSVGAPHLRDRVFIVAYPVGNDIREQSEPIATRRSPSISAQSLADANARRCERSRADEGESHTGANGRNDASWSRALLGDAERAPSNAFAAEGRSRDAASESDRWSTEPDVGRVAHGVPSRVDRLSALGNAVVPQVAEVVGRVILELERQRLAA